MLTSDFPVSIPLPQNTLASFRDSNSDAPYNQPSLAFNLQAAGTAGSARITAKVHGFWSNDVITLRIERDYSRTASSRTTF